MQHQKSFRNRVYAISERGTTTYYFRTTIQLPEVFVPAEGWASGSVSNAHADGAVREKTKRERVKNDPPQDLAEYGQPHGHVGVS